MRALDLILKKRDGDELSEREFRFLIGEYVAGKIPDYQLSAFLMAVFFKGMSPAETGFLTRAMLDSGERIELAEHGGDSPQGRFTDRDGQSWVLVDKHSTGGVGDKVSLILAPLAAACGLAVPMMSGRALGHTGGTLDKLESIPGYRTALSPAEFRSIVKQCGFAMTGQSERIVPADRLLYALRDVTGTVESIPLITASIVSKKAAEGTRGIVYDVKCGRGAFMKTLATAESLAQSLVAASCALGLQASAVLTAMDEPLGFSAGNWCEVWESYEALCGRGPEDLMAVTHRLVAHMCVLGGIARTVEDGEALSRAQLEAGAALSRFIDNVRLQGGDAEVFVNEAKRPRARVDLGLESTEAGFVLGIDAYRAGLAACLLGAGRVSKEDKVDPEAGVLFLKKKGEPVERGEALCRITTERENAVEEALAQLRRAYTIGPEAPTPAKPNLILKEIP